MNFSLLALVHPGAEALAVQEAEEILTEKSKSFHSFITIPLSNLESILNYLTRAQLPRRALLFLGIFSKPEEISLPRFSWKEIFSPQASYGLELEHISGLELRQKLMKHIGEQLAAAVEKECGFSPKFTFKKPVVLLVLHFTGKEYVLGIDLAGERQKRSYRIFTHHASFTGDLAAFLVRKSGFTAGEKLLVCWVKDGTIAIEAALFANKKLAQKWPFTCQSFPLFKELSNIKELPPPVQKIPPTLISACDVSLQNITAARKNAKLAGMYELIDFQKYSLEELDVKYGEGVFDRAIFHLTVKDEDKLNEMYYQAKYVLKKGATLLVITRKQLDLPIPEEFNLLSQEELIRGESVQKVWVMKKNF